MTSAFFAPATSPSDAALERYAASAERALGSIIDSLATQVSGDSAAALRAATELLGLMEGQARRRALLHPMYRIWRSRLTTLVAGTDRAAAEEWIGHLPRLLYAHVLDGSADTGLVRVPVWDDELRLPGLPGHLRLGGRGPHASLRRHDDDLLIERGGQRHLHSVRALLGTGDGLTARCLLPGTATELDATDPWIQASITEHNSVRSSPLYPTRDVMPAVGADMHADVFAAATRLIGAAWPECLGELTAQISLVVPVTTKLIAGWTSLNQLGAIYIRAVGVGSPAIDGDPALSDPVGYTAERLVHEAAHTRLNLLSFGARLIEASANEQLLQSPLRKDMRPPIGLFHAAFVLARVVVFMCRAAKLAGASGTFQHRARQCHSELTMAAEALREAGVMTTLGGTLLDQATAAADAALARAHEVAGAAS